MKKYFLSALLILTVSTVLDTPADAWLSGYVNDEVRGRDETGSIASNISSIIGIGFIVMFIYFRFKKDDDE
jgi:hypothetical protein